METIGIDLDTLDRVPLSPAHLAAIRAAGRRHDYAAGALVAEPGQPADRFVLVEEGELEIVDPWTSERHLPHTLGPTRFMGEISFLYGGGALDAGGARGASHPRH